MKIYKEYVQRLRKLTLEDDYIILIGDITPKLRNYVHSMIQVKFVDGAYHKYYGEMKNIINSFINFYTTTLDNVIREADKYSNVLDRNEALCLMESTISIHAAHQIDFGKEYLPITSSVEKNIYDEVMKKYNTFVMNLYDLRTKIEQLDKPEKVKNFANEFFLKSIKKTSEILEFTHAYISLMLVDCTREIKVSLEEIHLRLSNNLRSTNSKHNETVHNLLQELYDKNKEYLVVCRQSRKNSIEAAEIIHSINIIREKIEASKLSASLAHLEEEVAYWKGKVDEFRNINATVDELKLKLKEMMKQGEIYDSLECKDLPGQKQEQWQQMGENCTVMNEYLKGKLLEAGKVIFTFFGVRGTDRIVYQDNIGSFCLDEYNHQVYQFNYGQENYHINCNGEFKQFPDDNKYFYDENGRYIFENSAKYYQLAPCTSLYKLGEDGLFSKETRDCGHSVSMKNDCKLNFKDPNDVDILPNANPMDIKSKLKPEVVKYLWDSLGHILPDALHDVGGDRSRNPVQYLAHKILMHKYSRSGSEHLGKMKEADAYRANIYKERKEKAMAASKAWKTKQVQRRKPEESDDAEDRAVYDAQVAGQQFIMELNYYND